MLRISVLVLLLCVVAPAQVAILQIQVVEGEAAILPPGVRSSRPLTVEITDETGKPVSGAAVSFHLPDDGPGGAFASGLRTDVVVTDARGRATVHAFQANRVSGRFQVRIVASKEQARAGTVAFQFIAELKPGTAAAKSGHTGRWILVGLAAVGGGAAAALAASHGGSPTVVAPAPTAPVFSIGAPSISAGKP